MRWTGLDATRLRPGPEAFDLRPHFRWLSDVHSCLPSTIGPSLLLLPILGIVYPKMSRPHPLCLFSEVTSKLFSSDVSSRVTLAATFVVLAQ